MSKPSAETEVRTAKLILDAMRRDYDDLDQRLAPSKRGSSVQRLMDSMKARMAAADLCLGDALKELAGDA